MTTPQAKAPEPYRVQIDQLPPETVEAVSPEDASRKVAALIESHDSLKRLHDDEPVEIKRPDGRPWGRNLTLGAFREGPVLPANDMETLDGPVRPPSVQT